MSDHACKPLAEHLADRKKRGLVDIKFYIHGEVGTSPAKVWADAEALFDAIEDGAVEDFHFSDRVAMTPRGLLIVSH